MNVTSPDLLWIEDRCYRLPTCEEGNGCNEILRDAPYPEEMKNVAELACGGEPNEEDDVQILNSGMCSLNLSIPKVFHGKLVGQKGSTRRRIEDETRTELLIPRPHQDGDVTLLGKTTRDVVLAAKMVRHLVYEARQRLSASDFLSVPACTAEIKGNFEKFKDAVKRLCPDLSETLFTVPEKLHITISVFTLADKQERNLVAEELKLLVTNYSSKLVKGFRAVFSGLDTFHDDLTKTKVLFGRVMGDELQYFADYLHNHFCDTDWVLERNKKSSNVKMHLTLMNSRYLEDEKNPAKSYSRRPFFEFDSTPIFKELKDFYFGKIVVDEVHLSIMGQYGEDGYYMPTVVVPLTQAISSFKIVLKRHQKRKLEAA